MALQKEQRQRGWKLTEDGWNKIRKAIEDKFSPENEKYEKLYKSNNGNYNFTLLFNLITDNGNKKIGIGKDTFRKILKRKEGVDEQNIDHLFEAFNVDPDKSKDRQFLLVSSSNNKRHDEWNEWYEICRDMLSNQQSLTSNSIMQNESAMFERKQIPVHPDLVKYDEPDRLSREEAPTRSNNPQHKNWVTHDQFFEILKKREGRTNGPQIAVIGEPGSGKTTLQQTIAFKLVDKKAGFPILVHLRDLEGKSIQAYLRDTWLPRATEKKTLTNLEDLFKDGQVWLLLDGLDEMSTGTAGQQIANDLTGWIAKARVVLTCRLNFWLVKPKFRANFETYRLLDYSYSKQVTEFIRYWFEKIDASIGERLQTKLDQPEQDRIQNLVKNPLRLAMLCGIWQQQEGELPKQKGELPSTKAELYKKYVEMYSLWIQSKNLQPDSSLNERLEQLAKKALDQKNSPFRLIHSSVVEVLGEPKAPLFELATQHWLKKGVATEYNREQVYTFLHPTFQEYFAAIAIKNWDEFLLHRPNNPKQGVYRIFEPHWREVFLLWLGRDDVAVEQKTEFLKTLIDFEDECGKFYNYKAYLLAASGITELSDDIQALERKISRECNEFKLNALEDDLDKIDELKKNIVDKITELIREKALITPITEEAIATLLEPRRSQMQTELRRINQLNSDETRRRQSDYLVRVESSHGTRSESNRTESDSATQGMIVAIESLIQICFLIQIGLHKIASLLMQITSPLIQDYLESTKIVEVVESLPEDLP